MTERFLEPSRLWLLVVVVALIGLYVWLQFMRPKYLVRFANLELLDKIAPQRPGWRRHVPAGFSIAAMAVLIIAFAQPLMTVRVSEERTTIILAIDVSLSMAADDVEPNRLEAAQLAAKEFVNELPDRLNVGLLSFAGTARVMVPPTQDHQMVLEGIDRLQLDTATAIGDAVKLALDVIDGQSVGVDEGTPDAAVVLISDGETTVGLPTEESIPLAAEAGVAITTIAYGTPNGQIMVDENNDGIGQLTSVPVNTEELRALAEGTGGQAYTADSARALESVYDELGSTIGFRETTEDVAYRFVAIGLILMLCGMAASLRWFSRLP